MKFSSKFIQAVRSSVVSVTLTLTVADVELAIATITSKTKNLCQAIFNFPESDGFLTNSLVCSQLSCSTLPLNHINVEAIHVDAVNLSSSIEKETPDVNQGITPIPVTEADGKVILSAMKTLQPIIIDALDQIVSKKAVFQSLSIGGAISLIRQDLDHFK
ncbi:hypothetical protein CVT25_015088 [Psilocybe cyanescens]|uniref:Uncharacterized protein n=1 Tax=Psilocybe cyanescens TaxID=93625 RepID=A0A409WS51_PSICY|nr:hypothetical protein CVT25_015088 [Psilocybe cyanescens]